MASNRQVEEWSAGDEHKCQKSSNHIDLDHLCGGEPGEDESNKKIPCNRCIAEVQAPAGQPMEGQSVARFLTAGSDEANDTVAVEEDNTGPTIHSEDTSAPSSEYHAMMGAAYYYATRRDSSSSKSTRSWNSARKRFELFLVWLLKEKLPPPYAQIIAQRDEIAQRLFQSSTASSIQNNDIIWDKLSPENIQIQDVDLFASWLFKHGKRLDNPKKRIEYKTAECNLSSLVNHVRTLECKNTRERFPKDQMRVIREGMQRMFTRRVKQENRPLIQSHKPWSKNTIPNRIEWCRRMERDFYDRKFSRVPLADRQRVRTPGNDSPGGGTVGDGSASSNRGNSVPMETIGALLHSMDHRLDNLNMSWLDMKKQNQDLKTAVFKLSEQTSELIQQSKQQITQNSVMLQQILQLLGNEQGNAMAQLPLQQVATTPAPTENFGEAAEVATVASAPPFPIPDSLTQLNCKMVFNNWYLGYNRLHCNNASVRSHVKFVVEYLNLFLDQHITPEPDGVAKKLQWRKMLRMTTEAVWKKAQDFAKSHESHQLSDKLTSFKKFMQACDHDDLPDGPADGECYFQPDKEKLRNKQGLLDHIAKEQGQRSLYKKRKAVEVEIHERKDESFQVTHNVFDSEQASKRVRPSLSATEPKCNNASEGQPRLLEID